jgi:hypothetical protein
MRGSPLLLTLLWCCSALPSLAAEVVITAGQVDNFAPPADPASPSGALKALPLSFQNFDLIAGVNGLSDRQVAHTFAGLPPGIDGAILQLRVRAGNDAGVNTDGLLISFVDSTTTDYCSDVVWGRPFAPYVGSGCYPAPDPAGLVGAWNPGDSVTIVLDLAALPLAGGGTLNLIPQLNISGFIDVNVSDETGCDFMRLSIDSTTVTSVHPPASTSKLAILHQPVPNPFNPVTTLRFELTQSAEVGFSIYDTSGRLVRSLVAGVRPRGMHGVVWDGRNDRGVPMASGLYFATLRVQSDRLTTKVVLLK